MRNKYRGLNETNYVICLTKPKPYGGEAFTINKKYKIINKINSFQIKIENDYGGNELFNIHSPFGDNFCTLKYLRNKKLKKNKK